MRRLCFVLKPFMQSEQFTPPMAREQNNKSSPPPKANVF